MKIQLIVFIIACIFTLDTYACGTHGLHAQADVNSLICTGITNDVTIETTSSGDPILHLNTLNTIRSIGNNLIIRNNLRLTDISGLLNLGYVGGDLVIENNPLLTDCNAFNLLLSQCSVGGAIIIRNNGGGSCTEEGLNSKKCVPIPTIGQWGLVILLLLFLLFGSVKQLDITVKECTA